MISVDTLKSQLEYDPETGVFQWLVVKRKSGGRTKIGERAGFIRSDGYRFIGIDGRAYMAHKLAWLYVTGEWPNCVIDHADRDRSNDAFDNLRKATWIENCQNKSIRSNNRSGVTGVSYDSARCKWAARIKVDGKYLSLGRYADKESAVNARISAERKYFREFSPQAQII